jgi:integrase
MIHPKHRLLVELAAATGMRIGEIRALAWRHLELDDTRPVVKVRRGYSRGKFGPPKSKHGRRNIPLPSDLAAQLRRARAESKWSGDDDFVFANYRGNVLHPENVVRTHLRPVLQEVGAEVEQPWHCFRHTFASRHIERGTNIVQLSRLMGHHSPQVTLEKYGHLMDGDLGATLDLGDVLAADRGSVGRVLPAPASAPDRAAERV